MTGSEGCWRLLGKGRAVREAELRPRAAYDIESIVTYLSIVLDAPQAAADWYGALQEAIGLLCEQPDLGREFFDERLVLTGRRMYLVGRYRVFYSYDAERLVVWRVLHATQDIDDYAIVDLCD